MKKIRNLHLRHVEERLNSLKEQDMVPKPPKGWIRFVREALNMSSKALAKRLGVSPNTMSETEKAEFNEGITLKRLRRVADAMNCDVVYYFLPRQPIQKMISERANYVAEQNLRNISTHISLEKQSVIQERIQEEAVELRYSKKLWDD